MSPADDIRLRPAAGISARVLDDGDAGKAAVLVNLRSGQCWELNRIGYEIWRLLSEPRGASPTEMVAALTARCPVAPEALRADVLALTEALRGAGLVEVAAP